MTVLISCSNCWYNPLQSGALGSSFGYCVEHRFVLRRPDETTCSLLVRKDLLLDSAQKEHVYHEEVYGPGRGLKIVKSCHSADSDVYRCDSSEIVNGDDVVRLVAEYGELDTKIESLAQLRFMTEPRAEVAMLSLARGYTHRCVSRGGAWTSGLHLLWWTRQRLEKNPKLHVPLQDLRYQLPVPIERQIELVQWSLAMLRLSFVSDIGSYGQESGDDVGALASFPEDAAIAIQSVSLKKLLSWIKNTALPRFDEVLGYQRYKGLARELHRDERTAPCS